MDNSATPAMTGTTATRRRAPARAAEPPPRRGLNPYLVAAIVLITLGVVAVSYAGFQLYGTGFLAARSQDDLHNAFEDRKARGVAVEEPTITAPPVVDVGEFDDPGDVPVILADDGLAPLIPPEAEFLEDWIYETAPAVGEPVGRLVIPKIGVDWMIVEGVAAAQLRQGPGHMSNTAVPGQWGNAVISGHRTTYGAPFNKLDLLVPGDRFTIETVIGVHTYEVVNTMIVGPSEYWVTDQWDGAWVTFTTCHPKGSSRYRIAVFSMLVEGPNYATVSEVFGTEYEPRDRI